MYHIVSFLDTQEVEVVPAVWVKNGICLWPPYKGEGIQRATKCLEQPRESWSAYKIKIMYTAESYGEARRKLPLAELQTDLQSEAELESQRPPKRKTKRNRRLLEDYDTDDEAIAPQKDNLPHAPQIQPPPKRICSSTEVQPSPQRQPQPSICPQKSSCLTRIPETPGPSLLDISPSIEMQERNLGSSLRQAIDMPEPMPTLPFHNTPSSARSSPK
nr:uncharacterized protein LOC129439011 [Misgurnus anguillicaudatus]